MSRLTPLRKIDPPSRELRQTDYKDTEVTEALGGLVSHSAGLLIRYNHFFLAYEIQGYTALLLPQSLETDRNGIHRARVGARLETADWSQTRNRRLESDSKRPPKRPLQPIGATGPVRGNR
jgi:hypothetical protein